MAGIVDICNMAVGNLGGRSRIDSLDENSSEARACSLHYPQARDAMLSGYDWNFARRRVTLADAGTPITGWSYRYGWPAKCLVFRGIYQSLVNGPTIPYAIGADLDSSNEIIQVIHTDWPEADAVYTMQITNTTMFPALFVEALAWSLSSRIALVVTGKEGMVQATSQIAAMWEDRARVVDANQGTTRRDEALPDYIAVRGYT